jgi:hypothetical protein
LRFVAFFFVAFFFVPFFFVAFLRAAMSGYSFRKTRKWRRPPQYKIRAEPLFRSDWPRKGPSAILPMAVRVLPFSF